jgi:pentatricopeptide repeat protein
VLPSPAFVKLCSDHLQEADSVNAFRKITDPENPLRTLSAQNNLELYSKWDDALLIRLRLEDWHRVFENITPRDWDSVKISQEIKDQSLHLFAKMKSLGVTPDAFIYSTLFKIFSDDWKQVQEFYWFVFRITKDNLTAQIKTQNTLLNNRSYQVLLEIYNAKHKNYEFSLLNLWDDIKVIKIKLTRETYLAFLHSNGIEKTGDFVSTLHQKLKWRKVVLKEKWDLETFAALMSAYSLIGLYDVVDRLYVEMKHEGIKLSMYCLLL